MHLYESIFIINPNQTDEETANVIKKMQDVVAKQGGEMIKFEDWGKKKLAYEIKKQKRGHYAFFQFKAAPACGKRARAHLQAHRFGDQVPDGKARKRTAHQAGPQTEEEGPRQSSGSGRGRTGRGVAAAQAGHIRPISPPALEQMHEDIGKIEVTHDELQ